MSVGRRSLLAGLAVAMVSLVLVPSASAFIYWADSQHNRIGRASNDGTRIEPDFIQTGPAPDAVAVDASHIYWSTLTGGSIGRANIDGTGVDEGIVTGIDEPWGVALTSTSIYWASYFGGTIGKAKLDGSEAKPDFITGADLPCGIAVDSGHLYWVDQASGTPAYVARASLDGLIKELSYVTIPGTSSPCGVAVNTASIFWADLGLGGGSRIGRANASTGLGVDASFIGDGSGPCGVAIAGSSLYWANSKNNTIARANTDGTDLNQSFIQTPGDEICGVAVDSLEPPPAPGGGAEGGGEADTTAPQTKIVAGPGKALAKGRAKFRFRSSEAGSSFRCKLDRGKAARCRSPKLYRHLKAGRHLFRAWATDAAGNEDPTPAKRRFRVPASGR